LVTLTLAWFALGEILAGVGSCQAALVYPPAPEGGRKAVIEFVGQMLRDLPNGPVLRERGLNIAEVTIAPPHRWYGVGLKDVALRRLLSAATSSS
jgi:hypothetical protein